MRYALGPLPRLASPDLLFHARRRGECLVFGSSGPVNATIPLNGSWDDLVAAAGGSPPDILVLWLPFTPIPRRLWDSPVKIVGLAPHWPLQWHWLRRVMHRCDLVLSDAKGVELMRREGIAHARPAILRQPGRTIYRTAVAGAAAHHRRAVCRQRAPAPHRERRTYLGRLGRLAKSHKIVIKSDVTAGEYRELLSRAKIVFNHSTTGTCNTRVFEATTAGAMLLQEEGNGEVAGLLGDGYAAYNNENFETIVEECLSNDERRQAAVKRARERLTKLTFDDHWQDAVATIQAENALIESRRRARLGKAVPMPKPAMIWGGLAGSPVDELIDAIGKNPNDVELANAAGVYAPTPEEAAGWFHKAPSGGAGAPHRRAQSCRGAARPKTHG